MIESVVLWSTKWLAGNYGVIVIIPPCLISSAVIFFLAPVQDNNKPLDALEKKVYRFRARLVLAVEVLLAAAALLLPERSIAISVILAITLTAVTVLAGFVKN
jgi:accessory gene regulator B